MNKPAHPIAAAPATYEGDPHAWAFEQAALIRAGRHAEVDWDNVAEEIETVGRSERRSLKSNLFQVVMHMMKWDAQAGRRSRSWIGSIAIHRDHARQDLAENPSLKPELEAFVMEIHRSARVKAMIETNLPPAVFADLTYSVEDVFERPFDLPDDD